MFAIIKTGGKQYKVAVGDVIVVEKLEVEPSSSHIFDDVLMVSSDAGIKIGVPTVAGSQVKAEVLDQIRGEKIIVFKKKRRHNYRRKNGHRQWLTKLKIAEIVA